MKCSLNCAMTLTGNNIRDREETKRNLGRWIARRTYYPLSHHDIGSQILAKKFYIWQFQGEKQGVFRAINFSPNFLNGDGCLYEVRLARQKHDVWIAAVPESCSTAELVELNWVPNLIQKFASDAVLLPCFCRTSFLNLVRHGRSTTSELGLRHEWVGS